MVSVSQTATVERLQAQGWKHAPSRRPLNEHRLGEPVLMVRDLIFIAVLPDGEDVTPTAQQVSEW